MTDRVTAGGPVEVEDAPAVQDLSFRRYRGDEDLPLIVEVFEAVAKEDVLEWVMNTERLKNEYDNLPGFNPHEDVVLAEVEGRPVGYSQVRWVVQTDGIFAACHRERVIPEWRGRGITRALLSINEVRAKEMAAAHATGPNRRMGTGVADTEVQRTALLESLGWERVRWYLDMLRDLREPVEVAPLPEGIEVRPVASEDHHRVFEASWEAYRDSWAFHEMTEEDWVRFRDGPHFQPDLWVVGWDGDVVAGSVYCWLDEEENAFHGRQWGYNDDVTVHEGYRRRGLARALLSRSLVVLRDLGMEYANLGVDTQNPANALQLYESVGYVVFKEYYDLIRPLE